MGGFIIARCGLYFVSGYNVVEDVCLYVCTQVWL